MKSANRLLVVMSGLLIAACGGTPSPASTPIPIKQEVVMGFVPSQTTSIVQTNATLIADYLSKKTGYHVTGQVLSSYAAVTEGMTSDQVDIGWVGPLDYVIAHQKNGAEAVTKSVRKGLPSYKAFIIANNNSGINSIADLKGKKFAFGDPTSASSSLYPKYMMIKAGFDPKNLGQTTNIANQTQIAVNVCQGVVDAGAIYDDARTNAGADTSCPGIMTKTKIIATTDPPIPGDPQMLRHDMNPDQKAKLKAAMIALGSDPTMADPLKKLYTIDSLVPAKDSDYDNLRDVIKTVQPSLLNG
ncbi:MAG TPA: phosphate/phosphite/phosphonate ABC transporter substrate-binding protein [Candidatus Dormibacteraeota bacterium]